MDEICTRVGMVVRRHRLRRGWSQTKLADFAQIDRSYLSNIERGRRDVGIKTLAKLADSLELHLGKLFDEAYALQITRVGSFLA